MRAVGLFGSLCLLASGVAAMAAMAAGSADAASQGAERGALPSSHCRPQEQILYSCRFGRKVGSVCASGGAVHYRYGPPGEPEIDLASASDWSNVHVGLVSGQGGGHQSHVRFTRGRVHYIVFEGQDGSLARQPGRSYSGIHVAAGEEGGEAIADLECPAGHVPSRFSDSVPRHAPRALGDALWERENGPFDAWY